MILPLKIFWFLHESDLSIGSLNKDIDENAILLVPFAGLVDDDEWFKIEAIFLEHGVENVGWRVIGTQYD